MGQDTGGLGDIPSPPGFKTVGEQMLHKCLPDLEKKYWKRGTCRFGGEYKGSWAWEWGRLCERGSVWVGPWKVPGDGGMEGQGEVLNTEI